VLTGLRPSSNGVYSNRDDWRLSPELAAAVTLPMLFKRQGYRTLGAGKIFHAYSFSPDGLSGQSQPDAWYDYFPSKTQQMPAEVKPQRWPVNTFDGMYGGNFDWSPIDIGDDAMADGMVVAWLEQRLREGSPDQRPLFVAAGIYRPHVPWYVPRAYFDAFPLDAVQLPEVLEEDLDDLPAAGLQMAQRTWHAWIVLNRQWRRAVQGYLASILFADAMVGRLLRALDQGPMAHDTIVVLWSDHGYHLGQKQHWEKFTLWEVATRVPLIVVDLRPGAKRAPGVCTEPVSLLDLYPTLVELCGLEPPPQQLEGRSLLPQLTDPSADSGRAVVTTEGPGNHAVRGDRYRYIRYADGGEELYDHTSDPHEWHNLAGEEDLRAVRAELARWLPRRNVWPQSWR